MKATEKTQPSQDQTITTDPLDWHWVEPKSLKVNPIFESLIPLHTKEEILKRFASRAARLLVPPLASLDLALDTLESLGSGGQIGD